MELLPQLRRWRLSSVLPDFGSVKNAKTKNESVDRKRKEVYNVCKIIKFQEEKDMQLEALRKDMVAAMKAKDKVTKEAVSSLVAAAKKAAIDEGCRDDVPEALVDRVILKELKTVKEQLDTCPENREDLREEYQARYDVIAKYAPKQMDAACLLYTSSMPLAVRRCCWFSTERAPTAS